MCIDQIMMEDVVEKEEEAAAKGKIKKRIVIYYDIKLSNGGEIEQYRGLSAPRTGPRSTLLSGPAPEPTSALSILRSTTADIWNMSTGSLT
ncbi:hypothetical protein ColLi_12154 [Colletotrichum liriopes]|uniref:Uncharacterized protein n=1 Tax=Colletotrichum liriopes TaxID=708192 RepID=A0AA37GZP8_9PEZI|nr:hypothetical protein ColLi_12154 [Colletotrichum liriopes]